jgi:hypothetical protein
MWRGRLDDEKAALRVLSKARPDRLAGAGLTPDKRRLLDHLAPLPAAGVSETLWDFATSKSEEYAVRRHAVRLLTAGEPPPLGRIRELLGPIKENLQAARLEAAHNGSQPDDRGKQFDGLRAVAWILPSLRTAVDGADIGLRDELEACQADLVRLARGEDRMTEQRGLEASIAQGLKLDAVRQPKGAPDPLALALLQAPATDVFWFTRLLALQAVTIRRVEGEDTTAVAQLVGPIRDDDEEHPFVRECARLCASALRDDDWRPYVWDDMATVAAGHWHGLSRDATRLIGDLVVLLNLNERSGPKAREHFGRENRLPYCLTDSPDRRELYGHGAPPSKCPLNDRDRGQACLCPYSVDYHEDGAHRELSRAFCRHQRLAAGHGVPWQPGLSRSALKTFWERMEDLARF